MSKIEIGFEWTRAGRYEIAAAPTDKKLQVIRQIGRGRENYRPLEIDLANLHLRFAELADDDATVAFANAWGLLQTEARQGAMESLDSWRREIRKMRGILSVLGAKTTEPGGFLRRGGDSLRLTKIDVLLRGGPGTRPTLLLKPPDLLSAMWLQLANSIASGSSIRECAECGNWFHTGIGEKVRRSVAIFCSEKCKNQHHYKQRKARP